MTGHTGFGTTACAVLTLLAFPCTAPASEEEKQAELSSTLRGLDARVIPAESEQGKQLAHMLPRDIQARMRAAHLRENQAWQAVRTRTDWEKLRDQRLAALRRSLGEFPTPPRDLKVRRTGERKGAGYLIHNLVYESRPGLVVTANLYLPAKPGKAMPGILISHSQHNPKTQGELQDMGMTWARQGCLVLVPDQLGHGERRQHPFVDAKSYPETFRVGRQDVYFRYNTALQLHLVGESLMGWMVWDLMRGVDVLLAQPGIDPERIALLGAVAGGGDPAGVAAALDPRIAVVAPFNFGGPQPDYPIPEQAERDFYWFGVPFWESTRCLRLSARDGFAHWLIVSSVAPRRLLYSHEFGWDEKRDPAWPRIQKVFALYGKPDHLAVATGRGRLRGQPPENSHCNNIGAFHRSKMYPILQKWLGMTPPDQEFEHRRETRDLLCLTPEAASVLRPRLVYQLAGELAHRRLAAARQRLEALPPEGRRQLLRQSWARLLGGVEPKADPRATAQEKQALGQATVERLSLEVESGIQVPMLLLLPPRQVARLPVVVGIAQEGKQAFLKQRAEALAELLRGGTAVCLPDLRGCGETCAAGDSRHWRGESSTLSQAELMLGQPLVGSRLRDLRSVLRYLRGRPELAGDQLALWGDSFAPANPPERSVRTPLDIDKLPASSEPLGGLLALLGALFEDQVRAVHVQNGLAAYETLLQGPFCYVPHDAVVPEALTAGDLADLAAALAPRPLRLEELVDGQNLRMPAGAVARIYEGTQAAYRSARAEKRLELPGEKPPAESPACWLLNQLQGRN